MLLRNLAMILYKKVMLIINLKLLYIVVIIGINVDVFEVGFFHEDETRSEGPINEANLEKKKFSMKITFKSKLVILI